jgi:hypothetical protein
MADIKLVRLLKRLHPGEISQVRDFLNNTGSKSGSRLCQLYDHVITLYPNFSTDELTDDFIAIGFYKDKAYGKALTQWRTDSLKLAELVTRYLTVTKLDPNHWLYKIMEAEVLAERGLYIDFSNFVSDVTHNLESKKHPDKDVTHNLESKKHPDKSEYYLLTELNQLLYFHPATDTFKLDEAVLNSSIGYLEKYYKLSNYRLTVEKLFRQKIYGTTDSTASDKQQELPVFDLYARLIQLLKSDDSSSLQLYNEVKTTFENGISDWSDYDKQFVLSKLTFIANRYYEKGKLEYLPLIFELTKLSLTNNLLVYQGAISPLHFVNIVNVAANNEKFDWAEDFMAQYQDFLPKKQRIHTLQLAEAHVLFYKNKYTDSLNILKKLSKSGAPNHVQIECLYIRNYCELIVSNENYDYHDDLERSIVRLKHYLKSKSASVFPKHKIKAIKKMMSLAEDISKCALIKDKIERKKKKECISKKLEEADAVFSGYWLSKVIKKL